MRQTTQYGTTWFPTWVVWGQFFSTLIVTLASRPSASSFTNQSATSLAGTLWKERVGVFFFIPFSISSYMYSVLQFFHVMLFIMLCNVVLPLTSTNENTIGDHSNESFWAVLSCGTVYYAVQGGSNFMSVDETLVCDLFWPFKWKFLSSTFMWYSVQGW